MNYEEKERMLKELILNLEQQIESLQNKPFETNQAKETRKQLLAFYQNQLTEHLQYPH